MRLGFCRGIFIAHFPLSGYEAYNRGIPPEDSGIRRRRVGGGGISRVIGIPRNKNY